MFDRIEDGQIFYHTYGFNIVELIRRIYEAVGGNWDSFTATVSMWWSVYAVIAILFSLLCFAGYIYAKIRYAQLYEAEIANLHAAEAAWKTKYAQSSSSNARWDMIKERVTQNSPESWKVALIEADIMLDETLTNTGYAGESLGEKLKSANPASFTTLQDAWDAHIVRNKIAHAGSDFILTQRIAQQAITQFERVFKEFGVI